MLMYDKNMNPIDKPVDISIVGSGSDGNSVAINPINTMIDLGFVIKHYPEELLMSLDFIALTHEHIDHIKITSLKKILNVYPNIKIIVTNRMWQSLIKRDKKDEIEKLDTKNIIFINNDETFKLKTRNQLELFIHTCSTDHKSLINTAYDVYIPDLKTRLLYASDLCTVKSTGPGVKGLPNRADDMFNIILLEANYDDYILKKKIAQLNQELYNQADLTQKQIKEIKNELFRANSNYRHLSENKAHKYVREHLTSQGIYIPLHASSTFGTYIQESNV